MWLAAAGVPLQAEGEAAGTRRALLEAAKSSEELCKTFQLSEPIGLGLGVAGDERAEFTQARVLSRTRTSSRIELICGPTAAPTPDGSRVAGQHLGTSVCREFEIRWRDVLHESAAMSVLRLLNACWAAANVTVAGLPVSALTYTVESLGPNTGLVESVPRSRTLGELKRTFVKGDAAQRVVDHLNCEPERLARLAATTAALLASNYILGAAAGDGDNLLLRDDGTLFRTDFGYLFGSHPTVAGLIPFDAPVVWLPCAVTTALAERWLEVQQAALLAFQVGIVACSLMPPSQCLPSPLNSETLLALWVRAQATLLRIESDLHLPVEQYLSSLSEAELASSLQAVDSTFRKKLKTFLHDAFGYRSRLATGHSSSYEDAWEEVDNTKSPGSSASGSRACKMEAEVWRVAVCTVACMYQDEVMSSRLLESIAWCHLCAAAATSDLRARRSVLQALVTIATRGTDRVRHWVLKASSHCHRHAHFLSTLAERLRSEAGQSSQSAPSFSALSESCGTELHAIGANGVISGSSLLEHGAVCAVARSTLCVVLGWPLSTWPTLRQRESRYDLGPHADDGAFASRAAARVLVTALLTEDPVSLVAEVMRHADGPDMAGAMRALEPDLRTDFLRVIEQLAKDQKLGAAKDSNANAAVHKDPCEDGTQPARLHIEKPVTYEIFQTKDVRAWARSCLVAVAQDEDAAVSCPAVCAIACAVVDEDPELQQWAREASSACSPVQNESGACSPVHALMRMTRSSDGDRQPEAWAIKTLEGCTASTDTESQSTVHTRDPFAARIPQT